MLLAQQCPLNQLPRKPIDCKITQNLKLKITQNQKKIQKIKNHPKKSGEEEEDGEGEEQLEECEINHRCSVIK